jgi:hypothetical protein
MIDPDDPWPWWHWMMIASFFSTGGAAAVIDSAYQCPPRPVPWYTWACFWLSLLLLFTTSLWGCWESWNTLWGWFTRRWSKHREEPKE